MTKLTVFIEGPEKTISFDQSILVGRTEGPYILVKKATIFWNYNNVLTGFNDKVQYGSASITLPEGYYTYKTLERELGLNTDITLQAYKNSGKCSILGPTSDLRLGKLGELLGFPEEGPSGPLVIKANQRAYSPNKVEINRGLRYAEISCSIVDRSRNVNTHGSRSDVISSLPIPSDNTLKGSVTQYNDIESRVAISKGVYNEITFKVRGNNGGNSEAVLEIGSVLLELYIG